MQTSSALLVPLDGSDAAETALAWAACLAQARSLRLLLARVVPWPTYPMAAGLNGYMPAEVYDQIMTDERSAANDYLEAARPRLVAQGLSVETAVREGAVAENLLDLADENGACAIVMATHGRGGLKRFVLGSVADQIVQEATLPVLLVPARVAQPAPPTLGRVLVPLDGSALAERALEAARELIGAGGTLQLLRVVAPIEWMVRGGEGDKPAVDEATRRAVGEAEAYLKRVGESLGTANRPIESSVRTGVAGEEIRGAAAEQAVDLIVMATHGRTGPARWRMGSVADDVVRLAERPVFLVSARTLAAQAPGALTVGDVMTRDLATVRDDEPPIAALRKLLRRRVSGAPVLNGEGKLVGVISEHDLLRWQERLLDGLARDEAPDAAEYARRLETGQVRDLMSHPAVTIDEAAPLSAALRLLLERRYRRLPVVRDGQLVGVLARADVLKVAAEQAAPAPARATPE